MNRCLHFLHSFFLRAGSPTTATNVKTAELTLAPVSVIKIISVSIMHNYADNTD